MSGEKHISVVEGLARFVNDRCSRSVVHECCITGLIQLVITVILGGKTRPDGIGIGKACSPPNGVKFLFKPQMEKFTEQT